MNIHFGIIIYFYFAWISYFEPRYADNYCDAMDELEECFKKQGAEVVGQWPTEGYEHEDSKSVRGDNFVGCAFDEDNQPDMSEERAKKWVEQIKGEGIAI